jgi:multidrug efflux pump subunit AcrA (membrane-fusion protein)
MQEVRTFIAADASSKNIELASFDKVYRATRTSNVKKWFWILMAVFVIFLFLPWTQNIRARGTVTTLRQEQRPQELNTIIGGRIIKWHVKEGDLVKAGDTILQLAEIKDDYLDPNLIKRTKEQLTAKESTIDFYKDKVVFTDQQVVAMNQARDLKLNQLNNKLGQLALKARSDSMDMIAAINDFNIATEQYRRQKVMRDSGLASLVQLEQRNQQYQNANAKKIGAEIKFNNTKTDIVNTRIERSQVEQEYAEKIFKAQSERATAQSQIATSEGDVAKLTNQYSNYTIRNGQYFVLAPQDGQIAKAKKAGINEIVKEGEMLVEVVPDHFQYAVEIFVRPVDLPLLSIGNNVRFLFDGFPAIVFSGWPQASYGLFSGKVIAIENSVSANGKFRVLVIEDKGDKPWPPQLKMGTGASGIALLKDVPVWYELWRNINGFPPDYYKPATTADGKDSKKK